MEEYTSENALELLSLAKISLPLNELDLFNYKFTEIYGSSEKYNDFIQTVWRIYSEILPFEAHPDRNNQINLLDKIKRDELFQKNVIDSGISEKIREGISLSNLVKNSKINSFS